MHLKLLVLIICKLKSNKMFYSYIFVYGKTWNIELLLSFVHTKFSY